MGQVPTFKERSPNLEEEGVLHTLWFEGKDALVAGIDDIMKEWRIMLDVCFMNHGLKLGIIDVRCELLVNCLYGLNLILHWQGKWQVTRGILR